MTFGEARTKLRNDILAEASTDYYTDADLDGFLQDSAKEIALNFQFPTALGSSAILVGASTFDLPADAANVDLNEVSFDGFGMRLVSYQQVATYADQTSIGQPRYYHWDPKRAGTVYFAPKASRTGTIRYEYVKEYDPSAATDSTAIWDGKFPAYHDIVLFRAGHKAFDASLESDRAQYWLQREQLRSQEFSAFLNETPLNEAGRQEAGS